MLDADPAAAHAPHDTVTDIAFAPDFGTSGRVLAIVRGRLMRSDDRGMSWHEIVRGVGGEVQKLRAIEISPADPDVVFATSVGGEMLRSEDGGWSWAPVPLIFGVEAHSLVLDAADPDVVLTFGPTSGIVARSVDGGLTWARPSQDGGDVIASAATVMPDGRILVGDRDGRVSLSDDGGETWTTRSSIDDVRGIRHLAASTDDAGSDVVFAATFDHGLHRSLDGGATFSEVGAGLPDESVMGVAMSADFANDNAVWAAARESGAFRSVDGGETFERVFDGVSRSRQADEVGAAHFWTLAAAPGDSGLVLLAGFDGLFALVQGAETWAPVETLTGYIAGLDLSPAYADDQTLVVTTYVSGAFVSRDGGVTWETANEGLTVDGINEGNRFAPLRRLHNVHFSPDYADDDTLWGANWVRVIRSLDGGLSWEEIKISEPPEGSPLRQIVLAPSPDYTSDSTLFAATRQGEFFRSELGGDLDSWELLHTFPTRVRAISPSPAFGDDGTILVGTVGGLHRTVDGGQSWIETGVKNEAEVTGREIDFGIQVAVSPEFATDGLAYASTDSGLFRTVDSGVTWEVLVSGPLTGDQLIEAVAFSPTFADDGLLLVSVRGLGLVRSVDGGATFELVGAALDDANLLIADYANPSSSPIQFSPTYETDGTVFAYAQQALLRSTDGGVVWEEVDLPSVEEVIASLPPFEPAGDASLLVVPEEPDPASTDEDQPETDPPDDDGSTESVAPASPGSTADDGDDGGGGGVRNVLAGIGVILILGLGAVVVRRSAGAE